MGIKIKYKDPISSDFSPGDIIINATDGILFYKSHQELFKVQGSLVSGDSTLSEGSSSYAVTASYAISSSHEITYELSSSNAETASYIGPNIVDHDTTTNFVANEHIDHSSVTLTAGNGLTGGGDITTNRTFTVGQGTGVTVNSGDVAIGQDVEEEDRFTDEKHEAGLRFLEMFGPDKSIFGDPKSVFTSPIPLPKPLKKDQKEEEKTWFKRGSRR